MELHELRKIVYFSDKEEWVFSDDETEAPCESTYCLSLWWNIYPMEWRCGYVNSEDSDSLGLFFGSGKTSSEAITRCWDKVQYKQPYAKREGDDASK